MHATSVQDAWLRPVPCLHLCRVLRKVPDMLESFADKVPELLLDRNHGVLLAALALMLDMCEMEPAVVDLLRPHVPAVCRILRNLLVTSYSPEYDVGGVTDPFLQVKVWAAALGCAAWHAQWPPQ